MNPSEPAPANSRLRPASAPSHTAFWSVFPVFVALIVLQSLYLVEDLRQRSRMKAAAVDMAASLAQAQTIHLTAERVGRELLALAAARSIEAGKIVTEFQIRTNASPQQPKPAPATDHPAKK